MNFLSIAQKVTMNPDGVNTEALWLLIELHTKLALQRKKQLLYLIPYMENIVKCKEFLNYTGSAILINVSQFLLHWLYCAEVSSTTSPNMCSRFYSPVFSHNVAEGGLYPTTSKTRLFLFCTIRLFFP